MIKFFRKIRYDQMTQNQPNGHAGKTGKYFKYAISEIVLVVIGILIALSINNWNQKNLNKREELKQLKALKLEFENNLNLFDSLAIFHKENDDATTWLINIKNNSYTLDTFDSLFFKTVYNYNFDPSRGIFNSLINSGKIELISNETLKYKLAEIQDIVTDYIDDENNVRVYCMEEFIPFIVSHMPYNPLRFYNNRTPEEKAIHYKYSQEMINNRVFIEHLSIIKLYRLGVFNEGAIVRKDYQDIIDLISQEIEKMS
jgi:uncharacterized protein DUF6090